ncbi:ribonucleotide-diphosphate reductase subunit beta [Capnocytophaga catalasegens]|uniref:ribonucleoside-diphosphate reductase n=1 Tax=Capnocytophaga catalasegens TaxID=1004260 RepID=A0AAV5AZ17_9FLAO|nr:ribonucleotide-diphosphate reductase subunit beta [Capnocytophaga catalasegens]GIZ14620.1 ribonucleoside-diphosphate reductase subunit beta [Capnocytophaga catalasegens]GJM50822.1 ribonucleoside-diphosphate reductase subunit beta [Capnocytophaga catalasegens]GJM51975.1 ribonucleoside-diphosphate reductase subunit beta [Capnocytophaga catalasegens]
MNIFERRENYKPFEYPEVMQFVDAMNKSFWVHSEIEFTADVQDFKSNLSFIEKESVKRSLLGIAQVEVAVKTFWGDLYDLFPKPEFNGLGATFAECEFRHSEAYARLIEVLGYNDDFEKLLEVPIFKERHNVLKDFLTKNRDRTLEKMLFFTLVIENASLFSQFATILSFSRFKGYMKNIANIVSWTSVDEQIHANAGLFIIKKIFEENPQIKQRAKTEVFGDVQKYIVLEDKMLDWIFEEGEIGFFTKKDLANYMRYRLDDSLSQLGLGKPFGITTAQAKPMLWFEEEVFSNSLDDFFAKRPVDYTKHDKSITANDLF